MAEKLRVGVVTTGHGPRDEYVRYHRAILAHLGAKVDFVTRHALEGLSIEALTPHIVGPERLNQKRRTTARSGVTRIETQPLHPVESQGSVGKANGPPLVRTPRRHPHLTHSRTPAPRTRSGPNPVRT
jgi:hypothetical protein